MARPPTSRIALGSPLPNKGEFWNDIIDSHQSVVATRLVDETDPLALYNLHNAELVEGSADGSRYGEYLIVDGVVSDPAVEEGIFRLNPTMTSQTPDWTDPKKLHWIKSVIASNDILGAGQVTDTEINYANYSGLVIARLKKTHDFHDHCDINPDNSPILKSHPSGSWQILWDNCTTDETNPQEGLALVRYRGAWQRELKCAVPSGVTIAPRDRKNVDVYLYGTGDGGGEVVGQIEVAHDWFDQGGSPILENTRILAKWFYDQLEWVVVAADC